MNSTKLLRSFFKRFIVPTADRLASRDVQFFQLIPDESRSWYEPGPSGPPFVECSQDLLQERLEQMWNEQGLPELETLAKPLVDLAMKFHNQYEDGRETLSDDMYVMY